MLGIAGIRAAELHGNLAMTQRLEALDRRVTHAAWWPLYEGLRVSCFPPRHGLPGITACLLLSLCVVGRRSPQGRSAFLPRVRNFGDDAATGGFRCPAGRRTPLRFLGFRRAFGLIYRRVARRLSVRFKRGDVTVLVATDLAARGLDITVSASRCFFYGMVGVFCLGLGEFRPSLSKVVLRKMVFPDTIN